MAEEIVETPASESMRVDKGSQAVAKLMGWHDMGVLASGKPGREVGVCECGHRVKAATVEALKPLYEAHLEEVVESGMPYAGPHPARQPR